MKGFYSPIDQLAEQLPRTKGTGAEFMTELSKRPGYKPQEAQDRELQTLMALPKMERAQFLSHLKAKPAPQLRETVLDSKSEDPTKHEEWTLPGGENYREILLRMPHDPQRQKDPASGHWDVPDVLAHVRAKDRTGPNGEKILHIEEIQSDWHQQGREGGYQSKDMPKRVAAAKLAHRRLKEELEQAKSRSNAYERNLKSDMPMYQDPEVRQRVQAAMVKANNDIMEMTPQVMKAEAMRQELEQQAKHGVPDAPFKKNWHELALKKMIHHAAEKGYDSIAITPGEEQADRYKLSKHINNVKVKWHKAENDTVHLEAVDHKGNKVFDKFDIPRSQLNEYIGKEAAQKANEQMVQYGQSNLQNLDLKVGGEGMKGFYDKMVPSFLNQFGKKYGAQAGQGSIPRPPKNSMEVAGYPLGEEYMQGRVTWPEFLKRNPRAADEFNAKVHTFPITPEMREDVVKNGVPLYAKGGSVEPMTLYHGTKNPITKFEADKGITAQHIYTTPNPREAAGYGNVVHKVEAKPKKVLNLAKDYLDPKELRLLKQAAKNAGITDKHYTFDDFMGHFGSGQLYQYTGNQQAQNSLLNELLHKHDAVQIPDAVVGGGVGSSVVFKDPSLLKVTGQLQPSEYKAKGGSIKPVGYTKEKVTVSPNLDAMRYELMSVKHYAKKVK